jgi:hypothetical protein
VRRECLQQGRQEALRHLDARDDRPLRRSPSGFTRPELYEVEVEVVVGLRRHRSKVRVDADLELGRNADLDPLGNLVRVVWHGDELGVAAKASDLV